jgi:hypothetical protein
MIDFCFDHYPSNDDDEGDKKMELLLPVVPFLEHFLLVRASDEAAEALKVACYLLAFLAKSGRRHRYTGSDVVIGRLLQLLADRQQNGKEEIYYAEALALLANIVDQRLDNVEAHVVSELVRHMLQTLRTEDSGVSINYRASGCMESI